MGVALPEDEQVVRDIILAALRTDPERYLTAYSLEFGNVLNADNAATLFPEYNQNRAKYREAVHPAAQWIRDELFRRALAQRLVPEIKNRVVFTIGGNAVGKSTALAYTGDRQKAQIVFDSTLSNPEHAKRLIAQALAAGKLVGIRYVCRPFADTFRGMLERARTEGRVVTIDQLVNSARAAAETVRALYVEFGEDRRFEFAFVANSAEGSTRGYH